MPGTRTRKEIKALEYVGARPAGLQHGPVRGLKRKANTPLEGRYFVGKTPPPPSRTSQEGRTFAVGYVGKRRLHSRVRRASSSNEEREGKGRFYIGNPIHLRTAGDVGRGLLHNRVEQRPDSEEDNIDKWPGYIGERVHRRFKRRRVTVVTSDEDELPETTNDSNIFVDQPVGPPDSRTSATPEAGDVCYVAREDEEDEDEHLIVQGETAPEAVDLEKDDVPMRMLKDFSIYDFSFNLPLVYFDRNLCLDTNRTLGASGYVEPYMGSDNDSSEEASADGDRQLQRICISNIKEICVHAVCEKPVFELDPNVYIRTDYAWYILDTPSPQYAPFWTEFSIKERIFYELITAALGDHGITYEEFVDHLKEQDDTDRPITEEDLRDDSVRNYLQYSFNELQRECQEGHSRICARLLRAPAVQHLVLPPRQPSPSVSPEASGSTIREPSVETGRSPSPSLQKSITPKEQPEATVVTPRVYEICKDLYPLNDFDIVGTNNRARVKLTDGEQRRHPVHKSDPESIAWVQESRTVPYHFKSVMIDGVRYDVGDTIMVEPGEDDNKARAQNNGIQSSNPMAESKWFAKICYMYEEPNTIGYQMAHVQYYSHGAEIILKETAHPFGLFLLDECNSIHLDSIYGKVNLRILGPTEDEPLIEERDNLYFTGVCWDANNAIFFDRTSEEEERARKRCKRGRPCISCGIGLLQGDDDGWAIHDGILVHGGVTYHVDDFVYIRQELDKTDVYLIAQIIEVHRSTHLEKLYHSVDLRVYQRCDLILRAETRAEFGLWETDERRLFRSDTYVDGVDVRYIEGKAFVVHRSSLSDDELENWCTHDDHFYVDCKAKSDKPRSSNEFEPLSRKSFRTCHKCVGLRKEQLTEQQELMDSHSPLRGLELFAGAGGLSTGFDESGYVKTMWAVELGASACLTYEENHPYAQVYHGSVNTTLRHAIEAYEGQDPEPLISEELGQELPPMPRPGEVDFIYGGPPCQGFSRMNHSRTVDDYRNTLVCNMLSYVEFYHPKFFMLENVEGILYHPLAATQSGPGRKMEGGVRMGVVKLILRTLTSLGYQVHFKLLQAGQYGAPQSRLRVIFLGAQRGLPLPSFPIPTHCTADDVQQIKLVTGNLLRPAVRIIPFEDKDVVNRKAWLQFAPHLRVSVEDAISDLPKFDWINPALITDPDNIYEINKRKAEGIHRFDALYISESTHGSPYAGYVNPEPYTSEPLSRYQKWMRRGVDPDEGVSYQYTKRYKESVIECVVNVPLKENANHINLPNELKNKRWYTGGQISGKPKPEYLTIYARVNGKWHFQTALTSANPNAKGGRLLHPTQKRVLTIREFARAQGFPDQQKFLSIKENAFEDQQRQVGNAVPVPLAFALGKSIGAVLTSMWTDDDERRHREQSPEVPVFLG